MLDVDIILRDQAAMEAERSNFERLWQDIAELMLPRQADFMGASSTTQGRPRTERIYDETAALALDHGIAVVEGEVIPQGGQWQRMIPRDEELLKNQRVRLWFERKTDQLFALRNAPYSGFGVQTHESIASLLSFGLQGMWVDILRDPFGRPIGLGYHSEHIGQIFVRTSFNGRIDTVHRKFTLTHAQALDKWKDKVPECVRKAMRATKPDMQASATYLHVMRPNRGHVPGRLDARAMPITSCYVAIGDRQIFDEGGYRRMPLIVSRYDKSPTEDYGRCPAMTVLPAIKATQQMMADLTTAIEFMARPALGATDDMLDQLLMYHPGGVSYGALDDRGQQMVKRLWEDADIGPGLQLLADTRGVIKRAFFEDLYQIRQEVKTHVSATERMQRMQERGTLLAPLLRQHHEWFTPMAEREVDLMGEIGLLDDMPPEVVEAGGAMDLVYENPLTRARKAEAAGGFYDMLQGVTPLMQGDPAALTEFKREYPFKKVLRGLAEIHAVPASWESTDEEKAQMDAADAARSQQQDLLAAAPVVADVAEKLGRASQMGTNLGA